jgi:hypothetical protein
MSTAAPPFATIDAPAPGIYYDIPAGEYHSWDAASASRLTKLARSPLHMRAAIDNPPAQTEATALGDAIHCMVLEPSTFLERYVVAGQCTAQKNKKSPDRCKSSGKVMREGEWYCGTHDPSKDEPFVLTRTLLTTFQLAAVKRARENVFAHPKARALLESPGGFEVSAVWDDPETAVRCKGRADHLAPEYRGGPTIVDVKSTKDASQFAFPKSIFSYGYFRQGALYLDGFAYTMEVPWEHFAFIAVENTEPYAVAVYRLLDDAVQAGKDQLRTLLRKYAECELATVWPGYSKHVQDVGLPGYAWDQIYSTVEE